MEYRHTQIGYLMLSILIILGIFYTYISYLTGFEPTILVIMLFILLIIASFSTLTVSIDRTQLSLRFGFWFYAKRFQLEDIGSVKTVRNHWYYGWGIRLWLWPQMWIYNISGFDAVEIKVNGRTYRIGTDEPMKLEKALLESTKKNK